MAAGASYLSNLQIRSPYGRYKNLCRFARKIKLILLLQRAEEITQPSMATNSKEKSSRSEGEEVKENEFSHRLELKGDIENGQMLPLIPRPETALTKIES